MKIVEDKVTPVANGAGTTIAFTSFPEIASGWAGSSQFAIGIWVNKYNWLSGQYQAYFRISASTYYLLIAIRFNYSLRGSDCSGYTRIALFATMDSAYEIVHGANGTTCSYWVYNTVTKPV